MFMYLQKSKKGFTLIELMVVVAIIAVLALLGLRLYSTQQKRAKEAMVRANAGTVQVALQTELVDSAPSAIALTAAGLPDLEQLMNPFDNLSGFGNAWGTSSTTLKSGIVIVTLSGTIFTITPYGESTTSPINYSLTARK